MPMKVAIIKVASMKDSQKSRQKALNTVVGYPGVFSASFKGDDKDLIEVIGEGIDAVEITIKLRKKVRKSEIVSVGFVGDDKKKEEKEEEKQENPALPVFWSTEPHYGYDRSGYVPNYTVPYQPHVYEADDPCSIM